MKTNQIIKVSYHGECHKIDIDNLQNLQALRGKIDKTFTRLPKFYDITYDDNAWFRLSQQDFCELKNNEEKETILAIRALGIDKSQVIDILSQSSFYRNAGKGKEQSLLYEEEIGRSQEKQYSLLKQQDGEKHDERRQEKKYQEGIELPIKIEDKEDYIVNQDIQCDGCFVFPIKGPIFKCLYCQNFDLCSKCEQKKHSYHPLLKISQKNQYPISVEVKFSYKSKEIMQAHERQAKIEEQQAKLQYKRLLFQDPSRKEVIVDPSQYKIKKVRGPNFLAELLKAACY